MSGRNDDDRFACALVREARDALVAVTPAGEIRFWSEGAERLFGRRRDEAIGRDLADLVAPEERRDEVRRALRDVLEKGSLAYEAIAKTKEGALVAVDVTMRVVRDDTGAVDFIAVKHDDARLLEHLNEVRTADQRFRGLLEAAPDAMVIADETGRIRIINAQAEAMFGYARAELIGQTVERLIPARYRSAHPSHRAAYFAGPRTRPMGTGGFALYGQRKDGSEFPVEISLSPLETDEGVIAITAIRDVTERQRADDARRKLDQVQEALRMRDEFLSIASHELKTPLTAVQLQTDALLRLAKRSGEGALSAPLVHRLQTIQSGVSRLNALITQLLDLSRISAGRLQLQRDEVDLAAAARGVLTLFQDEIARSRSDVTLRSDSPVVGRWDASRVEQIVTNLLTNALKYGDGKPIEIVVDEAGGAARFTVRDHGIGIAEEHQARIFERFERVASSRNYGGMGLGLWIVRELVEAHGGSIQVWSQPGAGSTFTVSLPLRERAAATASEPAAPSDVKSVMIVDDDAMIRTSLADMLNDEGVKVVLAENGLRALEILRAGTRPSLILLDLMMPVMDAWAFRAEQLKDARLAPIPVAILSAADNIQMRAGSLSPVAYMPKPPQTANVLRLVERFCT